MQHIAIDLGGRESQICVRNSAGEILEERRWPTQDLAQYLASRPQSRASASIYACCSHASMNARCVTTAR